MGDLFWYFASKCEENTQKQVSTKKQDYPPHTLFLTHLPTRDNLKVYFLSFFISESYAIFCCFWDFCAMSCSQAISVLPKVTTTFTYEFYFSNLVAVSAFFFVHQAVVCAIFINSKCLHSNTHFQIIITFRGTIPELENTNCILLLSISHKNQLKFKYS